MSKLRSVIRHEYLTIVRQPSFWIIMVAIPLLIAVIFAMNYFSSVSSSDRIKEISKDLKNVALVDKSGLVNKEVVSSSELTLSPAAELPALKERVRTGDLSALVVYPEDIKKTRSYELFLSSNDITIMTGTSTLADSLLKTSLFLPLGSAEVITLAQNGASANMTIYKDGEVSAGFNEYIAPGLFVILFYIIFAFSISYMLSSVSEEKENRSMEMVLTYVKPRTLILGKLLAVGLVTLTQIAFFATLAVIGFFIIQTTTGAIALPFGIDLKEVVFNPVVLLFSAAFLIVGFLTYAALMTATAAIAPSTKEANSFSSVFFISAFVPFYFIMMIVTDPSNKIVTFLTYFPLTAPVVSLIRNTVGNLSVIESAAVLAVMTIFMVVSIWVAVRAFKLGALEFSQVLKISSLWKKS